MTRPLPRTRPAVINSQEVEHHLPRRTSRSPFPDCISVLVAGPHPVVRAGLIALIGTQPDMQIIGEADAGGDTLELASELTPDLVAIEIPLSLEGVQIVTRLHEANPEQKILVITRCEDGGTFRLLLSLGVRGYVLKRASVEQLLRALHAVATGGIFIDPAMVKHVVAPPEEHASDPELSMREADVLHHIALGYATKEIAARLKLSVKTVETYKTRAMRKLNINSRVELTRHAAKCGWIPNGDDSPQALCSTAAGSPPA